ncbi:BID domain-containing T4SS effector [Neorhizobium sp. T786]|uniref:BID domain-containing T4SS effector n=1 Tax=Pseudorhizobium xiangyangii TaxID=2883104 RepID=UPI001CFF8DD2|nr:BID domain-containing T4SS effector [Neorhizobium xiangyangii]MCB5205532.1 BID domain-containing T4SS effector [Neorhizobium xiangyangii]
MSHKPERDRPRSDREIEQFIAAWRSVISKMEARGADEEKIGAVEKTANADTRYFREQAASAEKMRQELAEAKPDRLVTPSGNNSAHSMEPLIPAQRLADLTPAEIKERAQNSDRATAKRSEVEGEARLVYGNSAAISSTLQSIEGNPALATGMGDTVRKMPEVIAPVAGEHGGWIRSASPERQMAETHIPRLANALEDYGNILQYEQRAVVAAYAREQNRVRQEVAAPSPQLSAILQSPASTQLASLSALPAAKQELTKLASSLDRRLAPSDHRALRLGDQAALSQSLKISQAQTQQLVRTHAQLAAANRQVQAQQRELAQKQDTAITITR